MGKGSGQKRGSTAAGAIFVIWFAISFFAIIFLAQCEQIYLLVAVFGQVFLVFGVSAVIFQIKKHQFIPIFLLIPMIGLGMLVVGVIGQFGSETILAALEQGVPYLLLGIFFIGGLLLLGMALSCYLGPKMRCKECVIGTCVEIMNKYDANGHLYVCPVYEVNYGIHKLRLCDEDTYIRNTNGQPVIQVGEQKELYINPENPSEFVDEKLNSLRVFVMGGLGLLAVAMTVIGIWLVNME